MNPLKNQMVTEVITVWSSGYGDMKEVSAFYFTIISLAYLISKLWGFFFWLASYHPGLICLKLEWRNESNIEACVVLKYFQTLSSFKV
jgi:hypothetical protein